jgi:hypothetical protein
LESRVPLKAWERELPEKDVILALPDQPILGVECIPPPLLNGLDTNADIFWLHIEDETSFYKASTQVAKFAFAPNLRLVLTSGYKSEEMHDLFDDVLGDSRESDQFVLTAWSNDSFADTLWEFLNAHGKSENVKIAKATILAENGSIRLKYLSEIVMMEE